MSANLTVIGMFNYDNTLLDGIEIEGIDKNTLINTILLRCGEFEVLYSNLQFFKNAIELWNDKHKRTFEKWVEAVNIKYNPIHNYDRIEEWENIENSKKDIASNSHNNQTSIEKSVNNTSNNSSNENLVSAYDTSDYQKSEKNIHNSTLNTGINNDISITNVNNISSIDSELKNGKRIGRTQGNVGVTTTQEMLQSEFNIARWNIYEQIADLFVTEFCLLVY